MTNGKLDSDKKLTKELLGLIVLIIGVAIASIGVWMVWGWGGILILFGIPVSWVGVRLCITKTEGKG
jgi:hypothetical protein